MKNIILSSFYVFLVLVIFSCTEEEGDLTDPNQLSACITLPSETIEALQTINFETCSQNATGFKWDFGDGSTSNSENPTHRYQASGTYDVKLIVSDDIGNQDSTTKSIQIEPPSVIIHEGFMTEDETWSASSVHKITSTSITIQNAILTIEAGTKIIFEKGALLSVGFDAAKQGAIVAKGTADNPILFTSAQDTPNAGDWDGVYIGEGLLESTPTVFSYCTFEYGGTDLFEDPSALVKLHDGGKASFDHCQFRFSSGYGLEVDNKSEFTAFADNHIHDIDDYAMYISGNKAGTIGLNNSIEDEGILIALYKIDTDVTWKEQTVPYVTESNLWVGSDAGNTLTLDKGVSIEFSGTTSLLPSSSTSIATIISNGTADKPVIFTAHDPDNTITKWGGVWLDNTFTSDTYFKHTIFELAESSKDFSSVVYVDGTTLNMENCKISGLKSSGIRLSGSAEFGVFANNDFGETGSYSIHLADGEVIHQIDAGNTFSGNKNVYIQYASVITADVTWPALDVYYDFSGDIYVGSEAGNTLTLSPGIKLTGIFEIGMTYQSATETPVPGTLQAIGTTEQPITFKNEKVSGLYPIKFNSQTGSASVLDKCIIDSAGMGVRIVNLYNDAATPFPTIKNCTFTNILDYGIYVANSEPDIENNNNTFTDIGQQDIYYLP